MSDDIVARLRDYHATVLAAPPYYRELVREAADEIERLRRDYSCICGEMRRMMEERNEAWLLKGRIFNEIDCRIEHGADSNGHLEAIRNLFRKQA